MRDIQVVNEFCNKLGSMRAVAEALSTKGSELTPQHVHNWLRRGRVAPQLRYHFLKTFNRLMPEDQQLDLAWLAVPATDYNGGKGDGRKSYRTKGKKAATRKKAKRRGARAGA